MIALLTKQKQRYNATGNYEKEAHKQKQISPPSAAGLPILGMRPQW
jgi:hypothetical protein